MLLMEQDKTLIWFLKAHNGGVWDMLETWRILPYRLYIYNIHICIYFHETNFHNLLLYYVMRKEQKHLQAAHNGIDVDNSVNFGMEIHIL